MRENSADGQKQNINHQKRDETKSWTKQKNKFHDDKYFDGSWRGR